MADQGRFSWGDSSEDIKTLSRSPGGVRGLRGGPSSPNVYRSPARTHGLHLPAYVRKKLGMGQHVGDRASSPSVWSGDSMENIRTVKYKRRDRHRDKRKGLLKIKRDTLCYYGESPNSPSLDHSPHPTPYREDYMDPLMEDPIRGPLRGSIPTQSYGAHLNSETNHSHRCYLDLFDPSVPVIRDPALDREVPKRRPFKGGREWSRSVWDRRKYLILCLLLFLLLGLVILLSVYWSTGKQSGDPRFSPPHVTAVTSCGTVRGLVIAPEQLQFLGVPYAVPPVGERRFMPAQPPTRLDHCWQGTLDAVTPRQQCWQYGAKGEILTGSEDCLHLDIFTPKLGYDSPLPVVVFVGGASMAGDLLWPRLKSNAGTMSHHLGLVLVRPSIRRGPFGVMASYLLGGKVYPPTAGGQAASDLHAVLLWVSRNIEHFGGDPKAVTLLGHRAGSALSYAILSSPRLSGLIHKLWLSGSPPIHPKVPWRDAPLSLNSPTNCSSLQCLQSLPPEEVMSSMGIQYRSQGPSRPWLVSDGVYIPFEGRRGHSVPIILGSSIHTASSLLEELKYLFEERSSHSLKKVEETVERLFTTLLQYYANTTIRERSSYFESYPTDSPWYVPPPPLPVFHQSEAVEAVRIYSELFTNNWELLVTLVSDAILTCPILSSSASLSRSSPSYSAMPSFPPHMNPHLYIIPSSSHPVVHTPPDNTPAVYAYLVTSNGGLTHPDADIAAIFGGLEGILEDNLHSDFIERMQSMFKMFVRTGKPVREGPTPAHLGSYRVGDMGVERKRKLCQFWEKWRSLAMRY